MFENLWIKMEHSEQKEYICVFSLADPKTKSSNIKHVTFDPKVNVAIIYRSAILKKYILILKTIH